MVFAGLNDLLFKEFTRRYDGLVGTFLSGVGLTSAIVFGFLMFSTSGHATGTGWYISVGAGIASILANILFVSSYRALPAGTGATIYRLNLVVVALLGIFLLGEPVTMWRVAGLIFGAVAVLILRMAESREDSFRSNPVRLFALQRPFGVWNHVFHASRDSAGRCVYRNTYNTNELCRDMYTWCGSFQ